MKRFFAFVAVIALSLVASGLLQAQSSPQMGTWKLNVAKSKYVGTQAPKSETRTVEAQGAGAKYTYDGVAGDGSHIGYSFASNYDGKETPISGAGPNGANTISIRRVNANTFKATLKKDGKVVLTTTSVVSSDGKVTTNTSKGTNAQGQPTSYTAVWDKQ